MFGFDSIWLEMFHLNPAKYRVTNSIWLDIKMLRMLRDVVDKAHKLYY